MVRISRWMAAAGLALTMTTGWAQTAEPFPSRTVTIVVGFGAGGGGDMWSRWMAEWLREHWKVPVIVENRPGAGGTIAAQALARAKPDGYTVGLATTSPFTVSPHLQTLSYDPTRDFTFLFQYLVSAQPLFVRTDSPHQSIEGLMAWAKANPGALMWSTAATNGGPHIATQAAFKAAGIDATYVPYKGGAEAVTALLGGQIQAMVAAEFPPFVESGRVRLLAETGPDRIPAYPDIRTYRELNFPVSIPIFYGIAGPAGLPPEVVAKWEAAAREMVTTQGFRDMISKTKSTPSFQDSRTFTGAILEVNRRMAKLIPELGMKQP